MNDRTKYDGKLTDALINTVIRAELRQWVREINVVPQPEIGTTPQIDRQPPRMVPVDDFSVPLDQKARPTQAEDAAAWLATHYPDGVDEDERGND